MVNSSSPVNISQNCSAQSLTNPDTELTGNEPEIS